MIAIALTHADRAHQSSTPVYSRSKTCKSFSLFLSYSHCIPHLAAGGSDQNRPMSQRLSRRFHHRKYVKNGMGSFSAAEPQNSSVLFTNRKRQGLRPMPRSNVTTAPRKTRGISAVPSTSPHVQHDPYDTLQDPISKFCSNRLPSFRASPWERTNSVSRSPVRIYGCLAITCFAETSYTNDGRNALFSGFVC